MNVSKASDTDSVKNKRPEKKETEWEESKFIQNTDAIDFKT